ncbi:MULTISPECIES: hypothetical protein [unclassified Roseofilum]|uniref:hypothetical protein n=1 Tax=unclassified Roseofilum TaxID=2620099 RepID=UPI001AFF81DD|nr:MULTISPECIES: hypothetical protein [unclassified Roseofilum]MBP0010740.1 hypothetical protein [Roseofilum sp. Belize Diploria]MBP0035081.1 hypothetical protein [Roseofilum sp. Belize BBD 4]
MNLYFLVEGNSTERKIYPKWLEYLIPELKRVEYSDQVVNNNYYLISGEGYPRILHDGLENAIDKIQEVQNYDYLVLCVDSDEDTVDERVNYIQNFIQPNKINLGSTQLKVIIQNRCIETWLLGNQTIFSRQPTQQPLLDYFRYYDVSQNDPELMGDYGMRNHADFHFKYLQEIFKAKQISYTKRNPGDARKHYYLEELTKRVSKNPTHLQTFQSFLEFCRMIKKRTY